MSALRWESGIDLAWSDVKTGITEANLAYCGYKELCIARTSFHCCWAMDFLASADKVRLRSVHGKYLAAEDDGHSVSQSRNKSDEMVVWEVKRFDNNKSVIRLRSCYGGYLTGSDHNFLLGWTGKKVFQTNPTKADDLSEWLVQAHHHANCIRLRTQEGTYLRANGGTPPWRNSVTHDQSYSESSADNLVWEVEIVEKRAGL